MKTKNRKKTTQVPAYAVGGAIGGVVSGAGQGAQLGSVFGPWGTAIGAIGGALFGGITGSSAEDKAAQELELAKKRQQGIMDTQMAKSVGQQMRNDWWSNNELVTTFNNGGVVAINGKEPFRRTDGSIDMINGGSTAGDNYLAPNLASVLGKTKIFNNGVTAEEAGRPLVKMFNKESKHNDSRARKSQEMNQYHANVAYDALLNIQEGVKMKNGDTKQKTKSINNTKVVAAENGLKLSGSIKIPPANLSIPETIPGVDVPGIGANNRFNKIANLLGKANSLGTLAPMVYNFIQSQKPAEVEPFIQNPYSSNYINSMSRRRVDTRALRNDIMNANTTANYNARNVSPNTGQRAALLAANTANTRNQLMNMNIQAQDMNNQYLAQLGQAQYQVGSDVVNEMRRINEINAQNRAARENMMSAAMTEFGKYSANNQMRNSQLLQNKGLMDALKPFLKIGMEDSAIDAISRIYSNNRG